MSNFVGNNFSSSKTSSQVFTGANVCWNGNKDSRDKNKSIAKKKKKMNITVKIIMKAIEITLKIIKLRLSDDCFLIEIYVAIC